MNFDFASSDEEQLVDVSQNSDDDSLDQTNNDQMDN